MIGYIFRQSIEILKRKPFMLWGVSLLNSIIVSTVYAMGTFVPIITIPVVLTLNAGMAALYLDGYKGIEVSSKQLFKGFTKECCPRVTAGMLWQWLWATIWTPVPVVGIIKSYEYAFTPYILLTRDDVSALDALKMSMKETEGYKLKMFGADILMGLMFIGILLVFALISIIPVLGTLVGFVGIISTVILFPLFTGLVRAGFYEEAKSGKFRFVYPQYTYANAPMQGAAPAQNTYAAQVSGSWFCTQCGAENAPTAGFCNKCGTPKAK